MPAYPRRQYWTLTDIIANVKANPNQCSCEKCDPSAHERPCDSVHKKIPPPRHTDYQLNNYGNKPLIQPLELEIFNYGPMYLANAIVDYFDKPAGELNDSQLEAIHDFKSAYAQWRYKLGVEDASVFGGPSNADITTLCHCLNKIFFMGAIQGFEFEWLRHENRDAYGQCGYPKISESAVSTIRLHPTKYKRCKGYNNSMARRTSRIGTLLHEVLHAFLFAFVCKTCRESRSNTWIHCARASQDHGRAWQVIAAKLEEVGPGLLGLDSLNLSRSCSLVVGIHRDSESVLPSLCDLRRYGFVKD